MYQNQSSQVRFISENNDQAQNLPAQCQSKEVNKETYQQSLPFPEKEAYCAQFSSFVELAGDDDNESAEKLHCFISSTEEQEEEEEDDVFGIGAFNENFITEEDLARAREKLDPIDVKDGTNMIDKYLADLQKFKVHKQDLSDNAIQIQLAVDFDLIGAGSVALDAAGTRVIVSIQIVGGGEQSLTLAFSQIEDLRVKSLSDSDQSIICWRLPDFVHSLQIQCLNESDLKACYQIMKNGSSADLDVLENGSNDPIDLLKDDAKDQEDIDEDNLLMTRLRELDIELEERIDSLRQEYALRKQQLIDEAELTKLQKITLLQQQESGDKSSNNDVETDICKLCFDNTEEITRDNAQKLIKLREAELKAETEQQKQRVKELRQERAERQKENEKKAEQFQVITNVRKLKRLKKKQMRGIVKKNASDFLKPKVYGKLDD
ncbi:hypothetical protein MP228_002409 [Amoeboaphelidium protococcarum]|nr:hypothetical protein MP228_002409 [Amoeboaphelidium protococcarum]